MLKLASHFFISTHIAGSLTMPTKNRIYSSPTEFIEFLKKRGLIIENDRKAASYASNIGYFRLIVYMVPFLLEPKSDFVFKPGTTFRQILRIYDFDKKLRLLLFNEIEKIEIAFRNAILYTMQSMTGDPYWLMKAEYVGQETLDYVKKEYNRSGEDFIVHFRKTLKMPSAPAFTLAEILSFGTMTWIYKNLPFKYKKDVARKFHLHAPVLESWVNLIVLTRNATCHHSRVWNRQNNILTLDMENPPMPWLTCCIDKKRVFYNISIIKYILDIISPGNDFKEKLLRLLEMFPEVDTAVMGFPDNWLQEPLWS